ncbi:MAG: anhydro-N-acetylmuramic acid kinase [Bacteroidetes bacterium]|nr:anhydro-N-acetylmuramic acid kinase [Bacteroidota bacterium]MBU1718448.1 anhydro-N-acetylmuramic acid kinase [Bacteroidota bacterium]
MTIKDKVIIAGLMSGTSLDGLDIAVCEFRKEKHQWKYRILDAVTASYSDEWKARLSEAHTLRADEFVRIHFEFGAFMGDLVREFLGKNGLKADYIASHGQTVIHRPDQGNTFQIGHGASLARQAGVPVICDFRSGDVAAGGQGAPLVPIGDEMLFGEYKFCVNLGGFSNISFRHDERRIAFDICPVNFLLNKEAARLGVAYDDGGKVARAGMIMPGLLDKLNELAYYHQPFPKSLGREWTEKYISPIIPSKAKPEDLLRTFTEHIAIQIAKVFNEHGRIRDKALFTGGGVYNQFLMERIAEYAGVEIVVPENQIVDFKEALIFAYLGLLRMVGQPNCLASVTGAKTDTCGGAIYL